MEQSCAKKHEGYGMMQTWVAMIRAHLSHEDGLTMQRIRRSQTIARKLARHAIIRDKKTNGKDRK